MKIPARSLPVVAALGLLAMVQGAACGGTVTTTTLIGPDGGVVQGPEGVRVTIPAGALTEPTEVAIRKVDASAAPAVAGGLALAGDVFSFEPHGLTFGAPVEVELPASSSGRSATILHASCAAGTTGASDCPSWDTTLQGVTLATGFARFTTRSFSLYAPASSQGGTGGAGTGGAGGGGTGGAANGGGGTGGTGVGTCSGVFQGNASISTDADVAMLSTYCEITGELRLFTGSELADLTLPLLQRIGGDFVIDPDCIMLKAVRLPALTSVKTVRFEPFNPELTELDLDSLATIDGFFVIGVADIANLSLPSLVSVTGDVFLYASTDVVDAPLLESVGGSLRMSNALLSAPKLATIGGMLGLGSPAAEALALPSLLSIGSALPPGANALDLDPWVGGLACAPGNGSPLLGTLDLPLLANLGPGNTGTFNTGNTPALPQCQIDELALQLQQAGWTGQVNTADATMCATAAGTCP